MSFDSWLRRNLPAEPSRWGIFFCDKNSNRVFVSNNERVQIPFHVRFGKPYVPERYPFHTCCSWCVWYTPSCGLSDASPTGHGVLSLLPTGPVRRVFLSRLLSEEPTLPC